MSKQEIQDQLLDKLCLSVSESEAKMLTDVFHKAELLDALLNQQRIRVLGTAGLGEEKYQHIGLEMWTRHLGCKDSNVRQSTEVGRETLLKYLRTHASAIRNRQIEPLES